MKKLWQIQTQFEMEKGKKMKRLREYIPIRNRKKLRARTIAILQILLVYQ